MDTDPDLERLAETYRRQGYAVVVRPGPADLPAFAKDFEVELVGRKEAGGVLVTAKGTRSELAAGPDLGRYADETPKHPGWRYDLAILRADLPGAIDVQGATEPSDEGVRQTLADAGKLAGSGFHPAALTTAWAGFEAAMRKRLSAAGRPAPRGTTPGQMLADLYTDGFLSFEDFPRLEELRRRRSVIVHGYAPPQIDPDAVEFLADATRRLLGESEVAEQPA